MNIFIPLRQTGSGEKQRQVWEAIQLLISVMAFDVLMGVTVESGRGEAACAKQFKVV